MFVIIPSFTIHPQKQNDRNIFCLMVFPTTCLKPEIDTFCLNDDGILEVYSIANLDL